MKLNAVFFFNTSNCQSSRKSGSRCIEEIKSLLAFITIEVMELRMEERNQLPIKKPCWAAIWYGAVQFISDIESSKTKTTNLIFRVERINF